MICYTSIFGLYDELKPHPDHPDVTDWLCFTDNPQLRCEGWTVIVEPARFPHPRLAAKWRKCHPPESETTLWVDGSMHFNFGLIDAMTKGLTESDWVMWAHPDRTSIVAEAAVSATMRKYVGLPLHEQVRHYIRQGWPDDRLWASTTMARRHTPTVLQAGAAWFAENEHWTYQDQLSLPVILDRYGIEPASLPYSLWRNPWFGFGPHASDQ